ncbi:Alpha/Beta hydrolase protein [Pyrenochaeta sp. MPI-SDFR-AT-0127]|nr:Alpha/Beta hydrolase protein [Pyrenochaeta sp. MPI-SDFR-AT-0127]
MDTPCFSRRADCHVVGITEEDFDVGRVMPDYNGVVLGCAPDPNNYYANLVCNQTIALVSAFVLESGIVLQSVPVAYSTWGKLNRNRDNVIIICHALTGSSDVEDWWRPLIGPGKALDYTRYFIFCANVLGSPYGSASPLSTDTMIELPYGPKFPRTTVRDDVRIHKLVLDTLGVQCVAAVIGGSMGGMHTLEWPLCTSQGYIKTIVAIATSTYQGAWGISWGETQRQAIYADSAYKNGWYTAVPECQPKRGLGTARMMGMLAYRSHGSFESRFGRNPALSNTKKIRGDVQKHGLPTARPSQESNISTNIEELGEEDLRMQYSAQSYLHYQAEKFLKRFDANCYIHLTKKMDTHDITRGRVSERQDLHFGYQGATSAHTPSLGDLRFVLSSVPSKSLVIGVQSDLLFPISEQTTLAQCLDEAKFIALQSADGHDGFLLEFEALNKVIKEHLEEGLRVA